MLRKIFRKITSSGTERPPPKGRLESGADVHVQAGLESILNSCCWLDWLRLRPNLFRVLRTDSACYTRLGPPSPQVLNMCNKHPPRAGREIWHHPFTSKKQRINTRLTVFISSMQMNEFRALIEHTHTHTHTHSSGPAAVLWPSAGCAPRLPPRTEPSWAATLSTRDRI